MSREFLPLLMKSTHGGMIVNNTSLASILGVPMQGIYNASKAAAASLTETLRLELQPFGIKVIDMKTGAVKSNFFANIHDTTGNPLSLPKDSIYGIAKEEIEKRLKGEDLTAQSMDQDLWAERAVGDLTKNSPPVVVWRGGSTTLTRFALMFFPYFLFDKMLKEIGALDIVEKRLKKQGKQIGSRQNA